jgi:catechol 2,3-dioxygenase-like lactoylglutathione lyase family enzyme
MTQVSTSNDSLNERAMGLSMNKEPLPRLRLGEIVLRTDRFDEMKPWYRSVLQTDPYYEHVPVLAAKHSRAQQLERQWATQVQLCFFRLALEHPYQQVIALFGNATAGTPSVLGNLHHLQLGDESPRVMARRYLELKARGIVPFRAMDHGPTLSFYYRDPDENVIEIAAPNHAEVARFLGALEAPEFARNPSGRPVDAEAIVLSLIESCDP